MIKHCIHEDNASCYDTAVSLLEREYGSPFKVACAYLERLKNWSAIKTNDAVGLRNLYRFLLRCLSYQKRGSIDLDSPLTIRNIQLALPVNLQDKWTTRVGRIRKKNRKEAGFVDFVEFVEDESYALNDPVYSRGGYKEKKAGDEKVKTLATDVTERKDE